MVLRRIRLIVAGLLGSCIMMTLLVLNNVHAMEIPVVAQLAVPFPYAVEGTPLVIQSITGYEGPYVEDGSDEEVVDIAAITVKNTGSKMLEKACITLHGEQGCMEFVLTMLPPDKTVIVLERNQRQWICQKFYSWSATCSEGNGKKPEIQIRENKSGYLEISNLSLAPVKNVTLMHKTWSKVFDAYLGGITYETKIDILQPGQMLLLRPEHYAPGVSQIVAIYS